MFAQADTCLRALGSGVCAVGAAERPNAALLLQAEWSVSFLLPLELPSRNSLVRLRLTETETRCEPLINCAARLSQVGGDEHALWFTTNASSECTPLDDMENSAPTQGYDWTSVWCNGDCASGNDGRNQTAQREPGAWPILTNTDNAHRTAHHGSCTMWVANACCEAGPKSKR